MNLKIYLLFLLVSAHFSCAKQADYSISQDKKNNLFFPELAQSWDEGIPLGNGMLGVLVWQKGSNLRFSLDRADLWDLHPMENLSGPEFSFRWVQEQVENNTYEKVQDMFDKPYDRSAAPTKLPGAALEFSAESLGTVINVILDINKASCRVRWDKGTSLETFVSAEGQSGWFCFENVSEGFVPKLLPPDYEGTYESSKNNVASEQRLERLGYKTGMVKNTPGKIVYRQKGWGDFEYEVAVTWKYSKNTLVGVWSISSTTSEKSGETADRMVSGLIENSNFNKKLNEHALWWKGFWEKSSIRLPDKILEKQWYLEQYKFGSVARQDAPPISLQAVWTADNGKLPPWKGDFHHDLNTQLSYWPAYSSNHLDLEKGFLDWLWKHQETFKRYTQTYFGTPGLNVPGVTTLGGEPMGGWIQYSFGPTVSGWLAQHFYLHWKYSMDKDFLENRAYPWIKDVAVYFDNIFERGGDGMRKLPISSSPEIHDNSINAWFKETTNYDLAFVRWTYEKAAELAQELGKNDEAAQWESNLQEWPDFALDNIGGLAIAPGHPYNESHRHFSHLVAWHPLGVIDMNNGDADKDIILATIHRLEDKGSSYWCGYSFSWLGNLYARAKNGEKAAEILRIFSENFCLSNSFHANGEQHDRGYSNFKYRPFTLEGNFAFAAGIQEMLIQSHCGIIEVFPAIPNAWKDVSFSTLRTQGAFLVSAVMQTGRVKQVVVSSETGGEVVMGNPFGNAKFSCTKEYKLIDKTIYIKLKKKENVVLERI